MASITDYLLHTLLCFSELLLATQHRWVCIFPLCFTWGQAKPCRMGQGYISCSSPLCGTSSNLVENAVWDCLLLWFWLLHHSTQIREKPSLLWLLFTWRGGEASQWHLPGTHPVILKAFSIKSPLFFEQNWVCWQVSILATLAQVCY